MVFYQNILCPFIRNITEYCDRNAFCINDKYYTYEDLGRTITGIRKLLKENPQNSKIVGLVANNDIETYASIFALAFEGVCYVPLHPGWPNERWQRICRDCTIDYILDSSSGNRQIVGKVLHTSNLSCSTVDFSVNNRIDDNSLFCILYTSGSTGNPKGVQLTRKNVALAITSFLSIGFSLNKGDKCVQCFDLSFAASIFSIISPLLFGACCYTVPYDAIKFTYVGNLVEQYGITFLMVPSSLLKMLRPYFEDIELGSIITCLITAELVLVEMVDDLFRHFPNMTIYNIYGSTECSGFCTSYPITQKNVIKEHNGYVSIGKEISYNLSCVILNENGKVTSTNEVGELCVGGEQLFTGYYGESSESDSTFFDYSHNNKLMRFFHTGDICYRDNDGDIMCLGRRDHQIKVQGFRVDLGEIEAVTRKYTNRNAVCLPLESSNGYQSIVMFVENCQSVETLQLYLRQVLPPYMVPTKIISLAAIPYNANGKIDRIKLISEIYD